MTTKTVVCPTCDAPLTLGRFACPSCGTLVASVATAVRPLSAAERAADEARASVIAEPTPGPAPVEQVEPAQPEQAPEPAAPIEAEPAPVAVPAPASVERAERRPVPRARADRSRPPERERPAPRAVKDPPIAAVAARPPIAATAASPASPWITGIEGVLAAAGPPSTAVPVEQAAGPSWPAHPSWPPPPSAAPPRPEPPVRVPAGLYLPPSAVLPPGETLPLPSSNGNHPSSATAIAGRTASESPTQEASIGLSTVVGARILAAGASIAALGFFLPWANFIIGNGRSGGWLDQWGFAGSGHPVLLLVLLAIAAVGVTAERLPSWVRPGLPAVALGGILLGIAWPYLFGAYGAWTGIYVVTVGALLLMVGGWLDSRSPRHAGRVSAV